MLGSNYTVRVDLSSPPRPNDTAVPQFSALDAVSREFKCTLVLLRLPGFSQTGLGVNKFAKLKHLADGLQKLAQISGLGNGLAGTAHADVVRDSDPSIGNVSLYACLNFIYFVVAQVTDSKDHRDGDYEKRKAGSGR